MIPDLAIIIPAYKSEYLEETLQSILNQSDQRFSLYIFDDASPNCIENVIEQLSIESRITFKRFKTNLGKESLTKQWERCIAEIGEEQWIWLFSDDDIMETDCVASFYGCIEKNPIFSAYRFDTKKISSTGEVIRENKFPETFDGAEFLNLKLSYEQESYIVEYIFSRQAYNDIGGLPDLPLAWASDDFFCLKLAEHGRIRSLEGGCVQWRYSDSNISGSNSRKNSQLKLKAAAEFVNWIVAHPKIVQKLKPSDLPFTWFIRQIRSLTDQLTIIDELKAVLIVSKYDKGVWRNYLEMKKKKSKILGWLKKFSS